MSPSRPAAKWRQLRWLHHLDRCRVESSQSEHGTTRPAELSVSITGQNTHFAQGTTTASFGTAITVVSLTVSSTTSATAVLNIDPAAATGGRIVTLTTDSEIASLPSGFTVTPGTPVVTQVNPNTGQEGQQNLSVTITGQFTNFVQGQAR